MYLVIELYLGKIISQNCFSVSSNVSQIHVPVNLLVVNSFQLTRSYDLESLHEPLIGTQFILELISRFSLTAIACITYKWLVQRQLYI